MRFLHDIRRLFRVAQSGHNALPRVLAYFVRVRATASSTLTLFLFYTVSLLSSITAFYRLARRCRFFTENRGSSLTDCSRFLD